jgi:hypothetical protein
MGDATASELSIVCVSRGTLPLLPAMLGWFAAIQTTAATETTINPAVISQRVKWVIGRLIHESAAVISLALPPPAASVT